LRQKAESVETFDGALEELVQQLFDTMYSISTGVGLAANQIGRREAVFVFDCHDGLSSAIANPTVEPLGTELQENWEACLSLPGVDMRTARYQRCVVRGRDVNGGDIEYEGDGLRARCFQHETDHLRGGLYIDLHPVKARKKVEAEMKRLEWWGLQSVDPTSEMYRRTQLGDEEAD
jgi:peptide deformylase